MDIYGCWMMILNVLTFTCITSGRWNLRFAWLELLDLRFETHHYGGRFILDGRQGIIMVIHGRGQL